MAYQDEEPNPFAVATGAWTDRVTYSDSEPIAFRPNQIVIRSGDQPTIDSALAVIGAQTGQDVQSFRISDGAVLIQGAEAFDVEDLVAELDDVGVRAEPNVVFFLHGCGCCCSSCGGGSGGSHANPFTGSPFTGSPFTGSPFTGSPFTGSPFTGSPFTGSPFTGSPFTGSPFTGSGARPSSARPADDPQVALPTIYSKAGATGRVIILDTGIAEDPQLPDMLTKLQETALENRDTPDAAHEGIPQDGYLDPVSGHGTFIAGIIEQLVPGQEVHVVRVLSNFGDGDGATIAKALADLRAAGLVDERTVINMSFGSYGGADVGVVAREIRRVQKLGAVVVASAGNDNTSMRTYPAAQRGVIGVGSIEAGGRAPYSNFGCWVRACAPGSNLTSAFFKDFQGKAPAVPNGPDSDNYESWAHWTGTSFAAPVVVAALLRHMLGQVDDDRQPGTAKDAMAAVVDSPGLFRFPGLGTVVNLAPGM